MQTIPDGLRIEEATLELLAESAGEEPTRVVPPEPTRRMSMERKTELLQAARRHPATIALIEEITAQVEASAGRQIELAKAELRAGLVFHHGLFHRIDLVTLGVFTTVNLLLVTVAFALSRVMAPWLAGPAGQRRQLRGDGDGDLPFVERAGRAAARAAPIRGAPLRAPPVRRRLTPD